MRTMRALWMVFGLLAALAGPAAAGEVEVVAAEAAAEGRGRFAFTVTLRHADEGWEHYADRWDVVSPGGETVYDERVLWHPHVTEQPFTRSLGGVAVPEGVAEVRVRGHDKVHGFGGNEVRVRLPGR